MENPEGVLNLLDEFAKLKSKEIPNDLEEYLLYVAASGDPVYQWSLIKSLYRQKLINVITEFYEMCPVIDIPRCPNVDPFNYETMKNSLLKRLDSFSGAPFTIQRLSELLTTPRKQYNRVDKFMRAIEKNIWVVSTREPGPREPVNTQETSTNLVNGVSPRVCVTVKHPKRVKSIEDRIKSGHPQLIDDDEEDDEEEEEELDDYEAMEVDSTEILPNNEADDTSLQCTTVKDLINKYKNRTIFSSAEEKTDFEEKSVQLEEVSAESTATSTPATTSVLEPKSTPAQESESELEPEPEPEPEPETETETEPETETEQPSALDTQSEVLPPTSDVEPAVDQTPPETVSTPADSVQEATSDTFYEETEKEAEAPVVAADSSSDIPVQENESEETAAVEEPVTLDSTSDISVDESHPLAESSTSDSELRVGKNDSINAMPEASTEPSTSDISAGVDEGFQPAPEPSLDSVTETQTKEADTLNSENKCI